MGGGACDMYGTENTYRFLVRKPEGRRLVDRPVCG